ncbi:MAG TPA: TetR/AcrR family transcriptional regulator [Vicinamibacterales bacterium]
MTKKTVARKPRRTTATSDVETQQRILDAAQTVFIRRGTSGARMSEIAHEAGVNQALLHYYFRSKERLSQAVFQQLANRLFPALFQTLASDASIDEKIQRLVALYLDNLSRSPFIPGYLLSELHHHPERTTQLLSLAGGGDLSQIMSPILERLQRQIDDAVKAGTMRPITPQQFAVNIISLCIFPFAARPMIATVFSMNDADFARFIEERKTELPKFIRAALEP